MTLKQFRKDHLGLTLEAAGERLGISKQAMWKLERNWPDVRAASILDIVREFGGAAVIDLPGGVRMVAEPPAEPEAPRYCEEWTPADHASAKWLPQN